MKQKGAPEVAKLKICWVLLVMSVSIFFGFCNTTAPEIITQGEDTYYMSRQGYGLTSDSGFPALYKDADVFCKNKGKLVSPLSSHAEKNGIISYGVDLAFRCLSANDPEYYDRDKEFIIDK
ncbi:MAG: hypothetical protein V2B20_17085 [Pseudomonadota bacterium]